VDKRIVHHRIRVNFMQGDMWICKNVLFRASLLYGEIHVKFEVFDRIIAVEDLITNGADSIGEPGFKGNFELRQALLGLQSNNKLLNPLVKTFIIRTIVVFLSSPEVGTYAADNEGKGFVSRIGETQRDLYRFTDIAFVNILHLADLERLSRQPGGQKTQ